MIRRAEHSADKRFTIISRSLAQNKSLSFQARGLLLFILSKPGKWEATDANLQKEGGIGKKALTGILMELKDAGYLRRTQERKHDGTIHYITEIFEEPEITAVSTVTQKEPTATVTPLPPTVEGTTDNKSTCARAGSSVPLTDLRDRRSPRKRSHKPPEPEIIIDPPYHSTDFVEGLMQYKQVRREMGQPLTRTMTEELYAKLAKFDEASCVKALHDAAAGGYKGVFPEKVNGNGNGHKKPEQEYIGPVRSVPNPRLENCPDCQGMGNVLVEVNGVKYAKVCKHERSEVAAA